MVFVTFEGNASSPSDDPTVFGGPMATLYYLPGTTGCGSMFDGCWTTLWNPQVQTTDATFGVKSNQFGFNIIGTSNLVLVVEASANLAIGFSTAATAPISRTTRCSQRGFRRVLP